MLVPVTGVALIDAEPFPPPPPPPPIPVNGLQSVGLFTRGGIPADTSTDPAWAGKTIPNNYVTGFVVNVYWKDLQPNGPNDVIPEANAMTEALAQAAAKNMTQLKVRFFSGIHAPEWAMDLGGGRITDFYEPQSNKYEDIPRFWHPDFAAAQAACMRQLVERYGQNRIFVEWAIAGPMVTYAEPCILHLNKVADPVEQTQIQANRDKLLAAGYTMAQHRAAFTTAFKSHIGLLGSSTIALNPLQTLNPDGTNNNSVADALQLLEEVHDILGSDGGGGNNSIRHMPPSWNATTDTYPNLLDQIYTRLTEISREEPRRPTYWQTATAERIGNLYETCKSAVRMGATMIELASKFTESNQLWGMTPEQFDEINAGLRANAGVTNGGDPPPDPDPTTTNLSYVEGGVWVIQQISNTSWNKNNVNNALLREYVKGFGVRYNWNLRTHAMRDDAHAVAKAAGKKFSERVIAGHFVPDSVKTAIGGPDGNWMYRTLQGTTPISCVIPWDKNTGIPGLHPAMEDALRTLAQDMISYARNNGIRVVHGNWFGKYWAELNHEEALQAVPGYSFNAWVEGHRKWAACFLDYVDDDVMMEFPLSGHPGGRNSFGTDIANMLILQAGGEEFSDKLVVQGNGWGDPALKGPTTSRPVHWAKQMYGFVDPSGAEIDWSTYMPLLNQIGSKYVEVYAESWNAATRPAGGIDIDGSIASLDFYGQKFVDDYNKPVVIVPDPEPVPDPPLAGNQLLESVGGVWALQEDTGLNFLTKFRNVRTKAPSVHGYGFRYYVNTACDSAGNLDTSPTGRIPTFLNWIQTINNENAGKFYKASLRPLMGKSTPIAWMNHMDEVAPGALTYTYNDLWCPHPCYNAPVTHAHDGLPTHSHAIGDPNDVFAIAFRKHIQQLVAYLQSVGLIGHDKLVPFIHGGYHGYQYSEYYYGPPVQVSQVAGDNPAKYTAAQHRAATLGLIDIMYDELPVDVATEFSSTGAGPMVGDYSSGSYVAGSNPFIEALVDKLLAKYGPGSQRVYLSFNGWHDVKIAGGDTAAAEFNKQMATRERAALANTGLLAELQDILRSPTDNFDWNGPNGAFRWAYNGIQDILPPFDGTNPPRRTLGKGSGPSGEDEYLLKGVGPIEVYADRFNGTANAATNSAQLEEECAGWRAEIMSRTA